MSESPHRWLCACVAAALAAVSIAAAADDAREPTGKDLAFSNRKGNCIACHSFPSLRETLEPTSRNYTAANIGPPLIAMKARFPDREKLRQQIANPMQNNPETSMPPFGKHGILSEKEIDLITEFIYGL
jgi:sulfur-oxidizing protein SoxX